MPKYKFSMILSSANVQTTAEPRFRAMRKTNPNFNMSGGCCNKNRNPLKGWRKEGYCCRKICGCAQIITGDFGVAGAPGVGTTATGNAGTTGVVIAVGHDNVTILLDDCDIPFSHNDTVVDFGDGTSITVNQDGVGDVFLTTSDCAQNSRPNSSKNVIGWQSIIKNVDNCCRSHKKMIQNRAASSPAQTAANGGVAYRVSGKIDKKYNHNYRQYLKKRCMLPDYYNATGAKKKINFISVAGHNAYLATCCGTDCSNGLAPPTSTLLIWKRSNWGFYKQGAVDNDIYISKKSLEALNSNALFGNAPCPCCVCKQLIRGDYGGAPQPASVGATATGSVSGATGSVISAGLVPNHAVIALDDCNTPFVDGERVSFSGGTTFLTVGSSGAGPVTGPIDCPPVPVRRPPQFPEDNPKNFNHNKNNLSNNF